LADENRKILGEKVKLGEIFRGVRKIFRKQRGKSETEGKCIITRGMDAPGRICIARGVFSCLTLFVYKYASHVTAVYKNLSIL